MDFVLGVAKAVKKAALKGAEKVASWVGWLERTPEVDELVFVKVARWARRLVYLTETW